MTPTEMLRKETEWPPAASMTFFCHPALIMAPPGGRRWRKNCLFNLVSRLKLEGTKLWVSVNIPSLETNSSWIKNNGWNGCFFFLGGGRPPDRCELLALRRVILFPVKSFQSGKIWGGLRGSSQHKFDVSRFLLHQNLSILQYRVWGS